MSLILISGINGFVGNNLVNAFIDGNTIYGLDIITPPKDGVCSMFTWSELDQIPDVDLIVHLAGKAHDVRTTTKEQECFDINVGLTQKIFEYFLESKATKFVFFSSVKAVADTVPNGILIEEDIPNPKTPYGKSKLKAEKVIWERLREWSIKNIYGEKEKKVYILRPCMIHGPGNVGNLNFLYNFLKKGFPWPLGSFENRRSFTSIGNIAWVIEQIMRKEIEPGFYQMADDESLSTNELVRLICESKGNKSRIWNIHPMIITTLAKMGDFFRLPLNSEQLKKLTESYLVSNNKIKKAMGIEKMPINADEGVKITLSSFGELESNG